MADRVACLLLSNAVFALESSAPLLHRVCAWPVLFSPEKREVEFFQYRWLTMVRVSGEGEGASGNLYHDVLGYETW